MQKENRFIPLKIERPRNVKNDLLSGLTVALALVPEAVAFSFVARVDPGVGLYAAFMMGLITAIFGGRPGMISGATGAVAVIYAPLMIGLHEHLTRPLSRSTRWSPRIIFMIPTSLVACTGSAIAPAKLSTCRVVRIRPHLTRCMVLTSNTTRNTGR